jgi:hypothetical protein
MAVTREQYVMQSVQDYLDRQLFDVRGYPRDQVQIKDAFTSEPIETPLTKNWVAQGFSFDDGGKQAEMGSTLIKRQYSIELFVFGLSFTWGDNLSDAIQKSLENDMNIPIVDIAVADRPPNGEALEVINIRRQREAIQDPPEWQRFTWTVLLKVDDWYDARL